MTPTQSEPSTATEQPATVDLDESSYATSPQMTTLQGGTEGQSQQPATLNEAAQQGVQQAITHLEQRGITVSEAYRQAALQGATTSATALISSEEPVSPETVRLSAYGATVGALEQTAAQSSPPGQSPIAIPNPSETRIDPSATSNIVTGAVLGTSSARQAIGDVQPQAVVNAAYGAAAGSTQAVLLNPLLATHHMYDVRGATIGASYGALHSAREVGNCVAVDPAVISSYVQNSAFGAARGALDGTVERFNRNEPVQADEAGVSAKMASYWGIQRGVKYGLTLDQVHAEAYAGARSSVRSKTYIHSGTFQYNTPNLCALFR